MSESKQRGDAVAVVGNAYQLFWVGTGPILAIMEQHGIKVGDRLYHGPAAEAAPELVEALSLVKAHLHEPECAIWRHVHAVIDAALAKAGA
ncbi:hypothetical protein [Burkholderia gladioli]|uniref:hypothetical protein n=1 Tax=Burkholderia gladioli TaxID=28095 RepID=UPI00163F1487|nr:hypothetical protein [Burkholderia gladioli]